MAMNPMQRKIRNSFLFGFLVAVIIAAVVVVLLYMRVKGLKEEIVKIQKENEVALVQVYAVTQDVQKDEILTASGDAEQKFNIISVPAQQVPDNAITPANLDELYKKEDSEEYQMTAKIDLSKNTVLTTNMVEKASLVHLEWVSIQ